MKPSLHGVKDDQPGWYPDSVGWERLNESSWGREKEVLSAWQRGINGRQEPWVRGGHRPEAKACRRKSWVVIIYTCCLRLLKVSGHLDYSLISDNGFFISQTP